MKLAQNRKFKKILYFVLTISVVAGAFGLQHALAVTPGLYLVDGNPSCANLYQSTVISGPDTDLLDLGPLFGFKYDANPTGDVSSTLTDNGPWVVTNGPQDPNNSVSIFNVVLSGSEGVQFDWSATLGIDAVIVKAQDSNAYVYSPEAFGAASLTAPDGKAVSHVEFCYDYELTAEKTANAEFTRTYTWDITKDYDETYDKFIGDPATTHGYKVSVDQTVTDSDFAVSGTITVYNPTPFAVTFDVSDSVDGTPATVSCPTYDLAANDGAAGGADEVTCTYSASLGGAVDGTNTATITSQNPDVKGAEATDDYAFGDPTTVVGFPEINVSDTNGESWMASGDDSWTYNRDFVCSSNPEDYTDGFYTYDTPNTATIVETGQSDDATVTVNCYAPVLEKDASASYDERHDWNIIKTVDPESQSAFAGDPVNWTWTIEIEETVVDQNFAVTGDIYVTNPAGSPGDMTVDLADVLNDGTGATVDCGGGSTSVTVAPGNTESCGYSASPADASATLNTATGTFNSIDFTATADVSFVTNVVNDSATFSDPYLEIGDTVVTDPSTTDYPDGDVCSDNPADYTDGGSYTVSVTNEGFLVDEEGTEYSDDATTTYTCYAPVLEKDASAGYDERHDWNIIKTVDPESQSAFAGDPVNWTWTIEIEETVVDQNFAVTGDIFVTNPAGSPGDMTVDLADVLDDGTIASVDCGGGSTSVTVAPGNTESCGYSASPADASATLNTATGTFNSIDFTATADVSFVTNVVNDSAIFSDPYLAIGETVVTDPSSTDYPDGDVCSDNPADYTDGGSYTLSVTNEGFLVDEEGNEYSDDATTTYTCYAPVVTKDATASYDERWTWTLEKVVDPTSQSGYPGDFLDWEWKVTVSEDFVEENFAVSGSIYVNNPAGSPGDMTVDLADQLNDGTVATVDCGDGATSVTVAPGAQGTCSYTASPNGRTADLNTATGTFNGISGFVGTADVMFVKNIVNGTATVDDDQEPDFPVNLVAGDNGTREWTETQDHTCSTSWADYGEDGTYSATLTNDATLTSNGGQNLDAHAETTYTCEAGTIDVLKTTDGVVDPTEDWQFALYIGPDGFGGTQVGNTSSTLGDLDGVLDFGDPIPALRPDTTYTVCEMDVPAGWATEWSINGVTVNPYNPNADDDPPEDFGNRCFDVGADTSYPVEVGQNLRITVDNSFPGGAPRTPGYWKNWSSCSGGGQYAKTTDDVDPDNEYVSLDEILNDPGITWDDILDDDIIFDILACEDAVNILDQRDLETERKEANDAAFTLAMHLLAYQLNEGAGACKPTTTIDNTGMYIEDIALAAEMLLDEYDFDGVVHGNGKNAGYLTDNKNPDKAFALELADYLDRYNNGEFCGNGND